MSRFVLLVLGYVIQYWLFFYGTLWMALSYIRIDRDRDSVW